MSKPLALIVGVGDGVSAAVARLLYKEGYQLALSSRDTSKIAALASETQAKCFNCDASNAQDVEKLFGRIDEELKGSLLKVALYNPSRALRGPISEVDPELVKSCLEVTAYGSFLVAQQASKAMLKHEQGGTILFTGASAGVKGFPRSAAFAMGKFAQRGLAESMARELHPQNIHVCWVNIDGGIRKLDREENPDKPDYMLNPNEVAKNYLHIINQHRSTWSNELPLRPWVERF